METKRQKKSEKGAGNIPKRLVALLAATALAVADFYVMICMPQQTAALIVVTILLLAAVYFAETAETAARGERDARDGEQYGELARSEKAIYLLVKKVSAELDGRIAQLENAGRSNAQDVIHAQKAVAKVSIGRNKENTDALMNSNDGVIEKMAELERVFMENMASGQETEMLSGTESAAADLSTAEILENQNRILEELENLRALIMETAEHMPARMAETAGAAETLETPEAAGNEFAQSFAQSAEEETVEAEPGFSFADTESAEPEAAPADEAEPEMSAAEEAQDEMPDLSFADETGAEPEAALADEAEPEISAAGEAEETPQAPEETSAPEAEKPPMPDLSDPNKVMSPEEIAALIANL